MADHEEVEKTRLEPIILANSNGTLIVDISDKAANFDDLERMRPRIHEDLRRDPNSYLLEYLMLCDKVSDEGLYTAEPINGAETLPKQLGEHSIGIFAAASQKYLHRAYQQNGLDRCIADYFSVFDDELRGDQPIAMKNTATFKLVADLLKQKGKIPVAYISHKPIEAEMGKDVYGLGILIDPTNKHSTMQANIVVVDSLDDPFARELIQEVYRTR